MTSPYVEPPQDLESLREHMRGHHDLDAAGLLPARVLLSMHEQDHAGTQWHGSPDASRVPGFTASREGSMFRRASGWPHEPLPGDRISGTEQHERLLAMREHMRGLGFPVRDTDQDGREEISPSFTIPDTGHNVSIGHSRKDETWRASISHPGDMLPSGEKTVAHVNLGTNAEHVPHLLTREMGSQPVIGEMRRQWQRAKSGADYGPRPAGGWRGTDRRLIQPSFVHFTARGATPPREDEDY